MTVKIKDPETGKDYPSVKAFAEAHGCNVCTVYQRLARGCSLEVALARVNLHHTPSQDHTGARFPTTAAMCRHWGHPCGVLSVAVLHPRLVPGALPHGASRPQ